MICKTAEYRARAEELASVEAAIADFLAAIGRNEPKTLYEAFQRPDRLSFIHFMVFPDDAAEQAHRDAAYTRDFVEAIYPRCEQQPVFTDVKSIREARS